MNYNSERMMFYNEDLTDFPSMVDEDIQVCSDIIKSDYDEQKWKDIFIELTSKYLSHVSQLGSNMTGYSKSTNYFFTDQISQDDLRRNFIVLKSKLIAFKNNGYQNSAQVSSDNGINIQNNLSATQTQTISISFETVKKQIEDMTGLSDAETEETLNKIDEIKTIVELKEPKKSKWQKIKPILIWLADKSVDVGIALMPLILKIGEQL